MSWKGVKHPAELLGSPNFALRGADILRGQDDFFALVPKCILCLGAYMGLGVVAGIGGGAELCGAPASSTEHGWEGLAFVGLVVALGGWLLARRGA